MMSIVITDLRLQHFRSYTDASFEFGPGVNIVVGPNASGKTNLLEALLVLNQGGSYRVKDAELIQFNNPWGRLDGHIDNNVRSVKLAAEPSFVKTFEIDGKVYKRLPLEQRLPVVLFEPNHLLLLGGVPELRRNYLDDLLEQTQADYGTARRAYRRTLYQRNTLLKKGANSAASQIFPWNVRLSEMGGIIARRRSEMVQRIAAKLPELYKNISQSTSEVDAEYHANFSVGSYESAMLKKLEANLPLDIQRGFTGTGPHREDFEVRFNGRAASETASRGEIRTAILCLKIIELSIVEEVRGQKPLLLLDDVFSELDGKRRHALTDYLKNYQAFITTTDADVVLQHFTDKSNIIPVGGEN